MGESKVGNRSRGRRPGAPSHTARILYSPGHIWPSFRPLRAANGPGGACGRRPLDTEGRSPEPGRGDDDTTLGGYESVHRRPPAFEGCDGHPYTVAIETERSADLRTPVGAYLVFPRWARTGVGVIGHVESPLLWRGSTVTEVTAEAGATPLSRVQDLLNEAIVRAQGDGQDEEP